MCSLSWLRMENDQGDLADIVRASCHGGRPTNPSNDWQFPSLPVNVPPSTDEPMYGFGDPFFNMQDPMVYGLDVAGPMFFDGSDSPGGMVEMNVEEDESVGSVLSPKISDGEVQMPCNFFSRMLQISTNPKMPITSCENSSAAMVAKPASPAGIISTSLDGNHNITRNTSAPSLAENGGLQISSQRNLGIKRRKGQAKKVVCIPAPAPTNSRPGGEVVPSDLWAWRKYGQKPIKGSPYPRGYYRCSSSKGCSARKQVERSRTDPNMLVITYTSEHNHPWPTQRNALAGSTRSQHMKKEAPSKNPSSSQMPKPTDVKEERKENDEDNAASDVIITGGMKDIRTIKVEVGEREKSIDGADRDGEFDLGFYDNCDYRPLVPSGANRSDDFFMYLGELEPDPLKLMFSQGISGEKSDGGRENNGLDPFSLFDW
ncbi:probable WRKY transcription factor 14 [Magnolia sinica]|uniref:probable WRKY transcription factor 14 n=1 Tax=Magnolia sinica TaxID=86752 RepID=UPI00265B0FF3|nr:probable WRKY transcription factor 14 [Magnolia sinica]